MAIWTPSLLGVPPIFTPALLLYHLLPLHCPLTLFVVDAPFGRFNQSNSILNVNGQLISSLYLMCQLKRQGMSLGLQWRSWLCVAVPTLVPADDSRLLYSGHCMAAVYDSTPIRAYSPYAPDPSE
jgi:hypothetical protein